jgi:hypothetical protein
VASALIFKGWLEEAMDFHPLVYKLAAGLAVWFVLSAWLFEGGGTTGYLFAVVSLVVLVMVGIPAVLGVVQRTRRRRDEGGGREEGQFGDWASHDVHLSTGPVKGAIATIEAILPIAAVAIGLTIFGVLLHVAR